VTYRLYMMTEADRAALNYLNETLAAGISAAVADGAGTKAGEGGIRIELPAFYDIDTPYTLAQDAWAEYHSQFANRERED